jgi:hypothetical protein
MKFGLLSAVTLLVAGFVVTEASAQETIKAPTNVVTTSDYRTVQPARTGLFSRLRNRNNNVSAASMTTVAPATIVPATTATPATPTTPTTVAPTTQVVEPRQGLFARLRARR